MLFNSRMPVTEMEKFWKGLIESNRNTVWKLCHVSCLNHNYDEFIHCIQPLKQNIIISDAVVVEEVRLVPIITMFCRIYTKLSNKIENSMTYNNIFDDLIIFTTNPF